MQAESVDPRVPEPIPEENWHPCRPQRNSIKNGILEKFGQNMSDNIIKSFLKQMEMMEPEMGCQACSSNQDQQMLAEELASAVIKLALCELRSGPNTEEHVEGSSRSARAQKSGSQDEDVSCLKESGRHSDFLDMDMGTEELQASRHTQPRCMPLSQSGLPVMGSLDYPDAPPTTPLLAELERNRHSFNQKLKGGLAKEFVPSPPPSTPKDKEDAPGADSQVEAISSHLMQSLSADDTSRGYFEEGRHHGAMTEAFAESLSCDIVDWVCHAEASRRTADNSHLHLLAHKLAETIITSSLDEAQVPV